MTPEEYWEFLFEEQRKLVHREHNGEPLGTRVVFNGFYGTSLWTKEGAGWRHEIRPSTDGRS